MTRTEFLRNLDTPDARLFASAPTPPWATSILLFIGLFGAFVLIQFGVVAFSYPMPVVTLSSFLRAADGAIVISLLLGFIYSSDVYVRRGALRNVEELERRIGAHASDDVDDIYARAIIHRRNVAHWMGLVIGVPYLLFLSHSGAQFVTAQIVDGFLIFGLVALPLLFSRIFQFVAVRNPLLSMFFHQHRDHFHVDVFEPNAYDPFVQIGMRSALHWLILFGIMSLLLLDEEYAETAFGSLPMLFILTIGLSAIVATYEFFSPLVMARYFIRKEKGKELSWVVTSMQESRDQLCTAPANISDKGPSMADLIAYERRLGEFSDWPVSLPDIGRFLLYLLIPALSWFGAAGAEIIIQSVLGGAG
jgi:hypothetical protein